MSKYLPLVVFAAVEAAGAALCWLAGYDFDHRGDEVSAGAGVILFSGLVSSLFTYLGQADNRHN